MCAVLYSVYSLYVVLLLLLESRHDDIQAKAAQAVGIFVMDAYRRAQVCSFISNFFYTKIK